MSRSSGAAQSAAFEPDGSITVPAEMIASKFDLTPDDFMRKLRGGLVSQKTEEGVGEDAGRHRLTFQFRGRRVVLVVGSSGEVVSCLRTHPPEAEALAASAAGEAASSPPPATNEQEAVAERIIDVRQIEPRLRHTIIFQIFAALQQGQAIQIRSDHDPKPLRRQFELNCEGAFGWTYLEEGPDVWRIRISRDAA